MRGGNRFTSGGFQFYNPGQAGWSHDDPFEESMLHDFMAEHDPQGYYANWLAQQGLLGTGNQSDFARSLQQRFMQGFNAAQFENPDIKWKDYLDRHTGSIGDMVSSFSPEDRGVNRSRYSGGSRWIPRSS